MEQEDRLKALHQMPLLAGLPHSDLEKISKRLTIESFKTGDEIIKQGAAGSAAYFIVAGTCEVRRKTNKGNRRLTFLKPGDFFGELSILVPAPRSATVIAQDDVQVFVLSANDFKSALTGSKAMALHLVRVLAERLQRAVDEFSGP